MSKRDKLPTILIIGSDSLIGGSLMNFLQKSEEQVVGTTRRDKSQDKSRIYLDLSENVDEWKCLSSVSVAVICAGVTKIGTCMEDPIKSSHINVYGVSSLIKNLVLKGIFVIYLSSNQVFGGSTPYCLPDDPLSPVTEYGKQKAEVEHQIKQWCDSISIVRFSKVLGPKDQLFSAWKQALLNNEVIYPFSDMFISPVPLSFAVKILSLVIAKRLPGILQVSGDRDISYYEAARLGAQLLGANEYLLQPTPSPHLTSYCDGMLTHTTLNISRLKSELGLEPPDVFWTLKSIFINPQAL